MESACEATFRLYDWPCLALASHKKKREKRCFHHLMQCNIFDLEQYKKSNGEITKIDWSRLLKIFLYIHSR